MERVIFGAEQARFLRGGSDEKERALGRRIHLREGAPQRDERRYTRCVINGAVKNLIAGQLGMFAKVIPMCAENHIFVFPFGITAFQFGDDVVRFECANLLFDFKVGLCLQCNWPKVFADGGFLQRIEILSGIS